MLTELRARLGREDDGFTLIELMVVVLIIAILLAIAIPTFLGARDQANARSTQSNLRNALTAEQTSWTNSQSFVADAATIEPSLKWETSNANLTSGGKDVFANPTASGNGVVIEGWAKDGNCYAIYQSNDPTADFTAYAAFKQSSGCADLSGNEPAAAPTTAGNGAVAAGVASVVWETSW